MRQLSFLFTTFGSMFSVLVLSSFIPVNAQMWGYPQGFDINNQIQRNNRQMEDSYRRMEDANQRMQERNQQLWDYDYRDNTEDWTNWNLPNNPHQNYVPSYPRKDVSCQQKQSDSLIDIDVTINIDVWDDCEE